MKQHSKSSSNIYYEEVFLTDLVIHSPVYGDVLAWTPTYTTFEIDGFRFYRGAALRLDIRGAELLRLGASFRSLLQDAYVHAPYESKHARMIHGGFQLLHTGRAVISDFVLCDEDVNEVAYAQQTIKKDIHDRQ